MKITVIISTLNRPNEVHHLLESLRVQTIKPEQVIVVDQSQEDHTERLVLSNKNLNIKYVKGNFKSLTQARNLGLSQVETEVTTFLDDDVEVGEDYLNHIQSFFKQRKGVLIGGIAWERDEQGHKYYPTPSFFWNLYRKIFNLGRPISGIWRVTPSFEGTFDPGISELTNSEWVSGSNFSVLTSTARSVGGFESALQGYSIGEDLDFPLRVLKQHPHSVHLDPHLPIVHHSSPVARVDNEKLLRMKGSHHYFLAHKHWRGNYLKLLQVIWSRVGIVLMPCLQKRIFGIVPDPVLLLKSVQIEFELLKNCHAVFDGQFIYKL